MCVCDWHALNEGYFKSLDVITAVTQNDIHLHAGVTFNPKQTKVKSRLHRGEGAKCQTTTALCAFTFDPL